MNNQVITQRFLEKPLQMRKKDYESLKQKYSELLLIVCEQSPYSKYKFEQTYRFVVDQESQIEELIGNLKNKVNSNNDYLYFFTENRMLLNNFQKNTFTQLLPQIQNQEDNFIHIFYCEFNFMGKTSFSQLEAHLFLILNTHQNSMELKYFSQKYTVSEKTKKLQFDVNQPEKQVEQKQANIHFVVECNKRTQFLLFAEELIISMGEDKTTENLLLEIKQKLKLDQDNCLYLFTFYKNQEVGLNDMKATLKNIDKQYKDNQDKVVYVTYCDYNFLARTHKLKYTFEQRCKQYEYSKSKDQIQRIPIVLENIASLSASLNTLAESYLLYVNPEASLVHLNMIVRKQLNVSKEQVLMLYIKNAVLSCSKNIFIQHKKLEMDKNQNQKKVFKSYQDELTIQDRKQKYGQLIEKYPNQFPVILQCQEPQLREKFLYQKYTVNKTVVLKDFFLQIQKKISDNNLGNIYFYDEKNQLISYLLDKKIEEIEPELRNKEDGFIYLYYTDKNPFWSFDYRSNKDQYTLEQRKNQYKDLNVKKDQVAITVEPHPESAIGKQFKEIDKKLMLSQNCTIKDLKNELLKSFWQEFKPEQLNIFVSKIVLVTDENKNVGELNQKYKDEDGFLYLLLCEFNPYTTKFKQAYTLEERKLRCQMAQKNFPDLLPVVIEPSKPNQKTIFSQKFFMLKKNMSIIELSTSLKQKFKINQSQALFLFIGKRSLIDLKKDLNQISNEFRDAEDQILYIQYCDYDVFG